LPCGELGETTGLAPPPRLPGRLKEVLLPPTPPPEGPRARKPLKRWIDPLGISAQIVAPLWSEEKRK